MMYNPQLDTFICVVEAGSFSKAADKLYISPPAVIKQINSLENNLGVQLFARTHRGLVVTAAGESLYQDAKYMVNYSKYEITPVEPYTSDDLNWTNSSSRVSREHDDESLRDIALTEITPADWDSYDTVLIGYPIWWGIAAWPVDNFVKGNDFTGKTVIPFCTSSSSGLGDSGNLLEEMAGTGDWQEGHRFSSGASDADAADWVASLNLNKEMRKAQQ